MYAGAHFRAVPARTQEWDHKVEERSAPAGGERQTPSVVSLLRYLPSEVPPGGRGPVVFRDTGANDNIPSTSCVPLKSSQTTR
jgi:hypothetical protein